MATKLVNFNWIGLCFYSWSSLHTHTNSKQGQKSFWTTLKNKTLAIKHNKHILLEALKSYNLEIAMEIDQTNEKCFTELLYAMLHNCFVLIFNCLVLIFKIWIICFDIQNLNLLFWYSKFESFVLIFKIWTNVVKFFN